jgi:ABC-type Zn uptake system ZnuABC Zn-binding protein ZnuA
MTRRTTLLIAGAAALAACSAGTGNGSSDRPRVVATTTQVGSVASEIGGDAIELTVLLEPGIEAHDFELTPEDGAALEQADLVLISGAGLEDWLAGALDTIGGSEKVRDLSEGVELRMPTEADPSPEGDEAEHGDEADPHYWLSAPGARAMVGNARDALIELAPGAEAAIADRAEGLLARLDAADSEIRDMIGAIPQEQRKIVTDHDALGYFIEEYGLEFIGSVFPTLDVASEPSARDIEGLVAEIRANGVTAIFTESAVDPRLAQALADETEARIIDEPLYTDSLGPAGSGADTLDGMLLHNARVIHDGLIGS